MKTMKDAMLFIAVGTMWCVCSGRYTLLALTAFIAVYIWRLNQ